MQSISWTLKTFRGLMPLLALIVTWPLTVQEFRATLTGRVTDASGVVIMKAAVKAINNATQQTYTGLTTKNSDYYIPYVLSY